MNKTQTKVVRMFATTVECLSANEAKWTNINAIAQLKNNLDQRLQHVKELDQRKTSTMSNPVTANKEKLKELLDDKVEVITGIMASYAEANELKELAQKVKILSKGFTKKRETDIEPRVNNILVMVRELMPKLADYALTEEMVVDAESFRDQFVALVGIPRSLRVQNSSAKKQIDDLISETQGLLTKQLDNLMLRFKISDPDFYNSYIQARIVVETATRHRDKTEQATPAE